MHTSQHLSNFFIKVTLDMRSMSSDMIFLRHVATAWIMCHFHAKNGLKWMKNWKICEIQYFQTLNIGTKNVLLSLKIPEIDNLESEIHNKVEKYCIFYNFCFGLFERDGFILDQCATVETPMIKVSSVLRTLFFHSNGVQMQRNNQNIFVSLPRSISLSTFFIHDIFLLNARAYLR